MATFSTKEKSIASAISIEYAVLILCCCLAAILVVFFLLMIKPLVFLRADILMWEETDFVGNVIKLNIGTPLYTSPSDSNSMIYGPLSFLVTYAVAWPLGLTRSIPALRVIQLVYVAMATLIATNCVPRVFRLAFPDRAFRFPKTWKVLTFLALFLAATSPYVNRFVYTLHVDGLSLLISMISIWTVLHYAENRRARSLVLMSICPALGFLTKQFLVSWIGVIFVFLFLLDPKDLKRLGFFLLLSVGFVFIGFAVCYALWGDNYLFWTVEIMGGKRKAIAFSPDSYGISIARGIDHIIRAWPEIFVGIIGGWILLKWGDSRRVAPLIAAWVALIASEGLSSGAGWSVLYHFGPGVLIGAVFMFAALPRIWEIPDGKSHTRPEVLHRWTHAAFMMAAVLAIFMAWHVVPTGDKNSPRYFWGAKSSPDVERYVAEIEQEFDGVEPQKVLLGVGSWVYLRRDVLQKDRAISLGDQPPADIYENVDVTIGRIRKKTYTKILVQDFYTPFLLYDWSAWPKPSGFREALLENYTEVKTIEPPRGNPLLQSQILNAGPVSVFVLSN